MSYLRQWAESRVAGGNSEFPEEIVQTVTLYPKWKDPETDMQTAVKCVLNGCFWSSGSNIKQERSAQTTEFSVKLFIPHRSGVTGRKYVKAEDWYSLSREDIESQKYWTVDPKNFPWITNHKSSHEFIWVHSDDTGGSRLDMQIGEFAKKPNVFRALKFEEYRFGINTDRQSMWHYVIYV